MTRNGIAKDIRDHPVIRACLFQARSQSMAKAVDCQAGTDQALALKVARDLKERDDGTKAIKITRGDAATVVPDLKIPPQQVANSFALKAQQNS